MEEQDIKEAKRARNFIWMAACDYDIEPLFLAFAPDGILSNFDFGFMFIVNVLTYIIIKVIDYFNGDRKSVV